MVAYREVFALYDSLVTREPEDDFYKSNLAVSYGKLGELYQVLGQSDTALLYFGKNLKLTEELYRDNSKNVELWFGLGVSYYKLGGIYVALGRPPEAIQHYERAAAVFREMYTVIGLEKYRQHYQMIERKIDSLKAKNKD